MCLYQKKMAHYEHMHYILTKNNLYSVDNTRYNNIFVRICHIMVYCDIFLQYHDIMIQKISYCGITRRNPHVNQIITVFLYITCCYSFYRVTVACVTLFSESVTYHMLKCLKNNNVFASTKA